jgi:Carboxypeptidase regulatory-like domain/TonB dependent receptor
MTRTRFAAHVALIAICTFLLTTLVQAQYRTSIQGVVTDPTGAVIPGATLTLTNPATGEKWVRVSNEAGVFNFNALAAAPFRLEVGMKGFETKVIENLELVPEQPNAVDVVLAIGSESTTVNVDASTLPALDTETASVNGVISSNQVQHMPSFGRDPLKLVQLAPGVIGDSSQAGGGGGFNLPGTETGGGASGGDVGIFGTENGAQVISNGNQTPFNGVTVDGISTTSAVWGGTTIITPSEDSIDNVKVVSNSYDAENGRFSGAQIQITSKGGSNQYHGSAFFTVHRPGLNAFQRWNGGFNPLRDPSRFNQIGGSVGGPIWKNKVFGFFNYETIREHTSVPGNQWAETPAFDALATSGSTAYTLANLPGSGIVNKGLNNVTCQLAGLVDVATDPVHGNCSAVTGGLNIGTPLNPTLFPLGVIGPAPGYPTGGEDPGWTKSSNPGTGGDGSGGPGNLGTIADITSYITTNPTTKTEVQYNGRLDADVTGKDRIGFAIYWVPVETSFLNGARAYDVFHHTQINEALSGIWNHTFSPTMLNEARFNAAGWRWNEIESNPGVQLGVPSANIDGIGSISINKFGPPVGSILDQWTYSWKDVATKIIQRHTLKFGGELTRLFYLNQCVGCAALGYNFFNMWDFLNDTPHVEGWNLFDPHTGKPTAQRQDDRENIWGFFVQDDYKVRSNLTLSLGLRWSYFGPLYDKGGNMYVANPGAGSNYLTDLVVKKGNSWTAQKNNFSPEIGFAWSPNQFGGKMVFRGGYGLNYNQEELAISANVQGNPGLSIGESISQDTPSAANPGILYALSSDPHSLSGYPPNPNFVLSFGSNGLPTNGSVGVAIWPSTMPTLRVHHYSFDMQYDLGHQLVASLGYQGSLSRDILFHQNPLAVPATQGYAQNPQINGGDYWSSIGKANYNAMLAELKHEFSRQFMADVQYTWARSNDDTSRPYSEPYYPFNPNLSYGRSDFNIGQSFKLYGMWQPVFFHGNNLLEKIAGGWSISGILNWHSGFPWSPITDVYGKLYCGQCGYSTVYPAAYLGGAGHSTSNDAFKNPSTSNFPKPPVSGVSPYFAAPVPCSPPTVTTNCYVTYGGTDSGTALPPSPGFGRNSLNGPGYKGVDMTLAKAFGLPNMPVLGENAKFEFRVDAYNIFNNLNLNMNNISNNIGSSNFGTISGALAARTVTMGLRFSF